MEEKDKVTEALDEMASRDLGEIKVLMIEDDPFLTEMVLERLVASGCIPYGAGTADEGLALARQFSPSAIILDLMLPGMSGEEFIASIKKDDSLKHIPVIVFSNKGDEESVNNLLQLGAAKYFVKSSTDIDQLAEVVKELATA